jgi:hypothetical protein
MAILGEDIINNNGFIYYVLCHKNELFQKIEKEHQIILQKKPKTKMNTSTSFETELEQEPYPQFTKKEYDNYIKQTYKCKFKTPQEEFDWAKTQSKICSKCNIQKRLTEYKGNTAGADAFDKSGYRLRRPECNTCYKEISSGKTIAKKIAKEMGISYTAPEGTTCAICDLPPTPSNCLVFDHCHEKNIFRGYCCNSCNRGMGVLGDNIDGLLKALNYLLKNDKSKIIQGEDGLLIRYDA